jgi:tRNA(Ile)-lysidine synthase
MARNTTVLSVHRRVRAALERSRIVDRSLVVAVSGGPDSLALLHALLSLRDKLRLRLHGAHLDHGLRGDASASDAEFVAGTFEHLGVPGTIERADVDAFRTEHGMSLELAAREVRYAFLAGVATEQHADAVALGHTADDQVETVLMHLIRGSGLTGLRGMAAVSRREIAGLETTILRPLLSVSREETAEYCRAAGLSPRLDESNLSREMTRNRIRSDLLPLLEQFNPAIRDAIMRLSGSAARDLEFLESEADTAWEDAASEGEAGVTLRRDALDRLAPAIQRRVLMRALAFVSGGPQDVEETHIESMARLLDGPAGKSLDLPGRARFSVGYESATLHSLESDTRGLPSLEGRHPLNIPGDTDLPGWRVTTQFVDDEGLVSRDGHTAVLGYSRLSGPLAVRSRVQGDRFQPLGMKVAKKLQDFMVDSKVPRECRDRVPLVVSNRGIAWVVGWRIADWAKVQSGDTRVLELTFRRAQ